MKFLRHFFSLLRTSCLVVTGASSGGASCATAGDSAAATLITPGHLQRYGDFRHRKSLTAKNFLLAPHTVIPINWYSDQLALATPFEHIQISLFTKGFRI